MKSELNEDEIEFLINKGYSISLYIVRPENQKIEANQILLEKVRPKSRDNLPLNRNIYLIHLKHLAAVELRKRVKLDLLGKKAPEIKR